MRIAHIIAIVFGIIMLTFTYIWYGKKKKDNYLLIIWSVIWVVFIVGILLFRFIEKFSTVFIKIEVMDFFVFVAILFILIMLFIIYGLVKTNQKKIEEIVEEIALRRKK